MHLSLIENQFLRARPRVSGPSLLSDLILGSYARSPHAREYDKVKFQLLLDLSAQGRTATPVKTDKSGLWVRIAPNPGQLDKRSIKRSLHADRIGKLRRMSKLINRTEDKIYEQFAGSNEVLQSDFHIELEVCESREQSDFFRYCRLLSSIPYKDYVGRRVRILVRDLSFSQKPIIGIIALGSPIINLAARNEWIGWPRDSVEKGRFPQYLNYTMDLYVAIPLPPYNQLLAGKLLCYVAASNEVRDIIASKYKHSKFNQLSLITATSFYGRSSLYNRINFGNSRLYIPAGYSSGYGSMHLSEKTIEGLKAVSEKFSSGKYNNGLAAGKNHIFHLLEDACRQLRVHPRSALNHGIGREVFVLPLLTNTREFLTGRESELTPRDLPLDDMVGYWKGRWLKTRKERKQTVHAIKAFSKKSLRLSLVTD